MIRHSLELLIQKYGLHGGIKVSVGLRSRLEAPCVSSKEQVTENTPGSTKKTSFKLDFQIYLGLAAEKGNFPLPVGQGVQSCQRPPTQPFPF